MCDHRFKGRVPSIAEMRAAELKAQQREQKENLQALEQEKSVLETEGKKPFVGAFRAQTIKNRLAEIESKIRAITAPAPQKEVAVA